MYMYPYFKIWYIYPYNNFHFKGRDGKEFKNEYKQ